jgi:hypothetical protein
MLTYQMTSAETETWMLGGPAQAEIETAIAEQVTALTVEDVLVQLDDGSVAYALEVGR